MSFCVITAAQHPCTVSLHKHANPRGISWRQPLIVPIIPIIPIIPIMRPPALPCIPPMPSQILITTPARLTTKVRRKSIPLCYHSGTAPLHRFTAKACKPSGYLMAPLSGLSDMSDKCARQRSPAYRRCRHNSKTRSCAHLHTPAHALAR